MGLFYEDEVSMTFNRPTLWPAFNLVSLHIKVKVQYVTDI